MKVLIVGDFCERYRVADCVSKEQYDLLFADIKPIVEKADVSIVNFEMPILQNQAKPIKKCGPNLGGHTNSIDAVKYAGFNVCTLANNHILDQGEECCVDTVRLLHEADIRTVGAGKDINQAGQTLYITKDNKTLAIINCCEHEFTIATPTTAGANPLNAVHQYYAIRQARQKADYVIVIVHGGHEHWQLPSPRMTETYRFFIDCGADAVVNHHQHCYSGYETYKGKPIFYGLGNLCFDERTPRQNSIWNYGYMAEIDFTQNNEPQFKIYPYEQCGKEVGVHLLKEDAFDTKLVELNAIIVDKQQLKQKTDEYYKKCSSSYATIFEPLQNRIIIALQSRGLLPFLRKNKSLYRIYNYLFCESHFDKVRYYLENKCIK